MAVSAVRPNAGFDLGPLVKRCLDFQRTRQLSNRSIGELGIHLGALRSFCRERELSTIQQLTPGFLLEFVQSFKHRNSPALIKAVVWTLRTFGAWCAVMGHLPANPAAGLSHPKLPPRRRLPEYLKPGELRALLETVARHGDLQELTVLSLLATVGLRPNEICALRRCDISIGEQYVFAKVKGNWYKRTPISDAMAETLQDYLTEFPFRDDPLFINQWNRPVEIRWVQRLVRKSARQAGIRRRITPRILRHTFATYMADRHGKTLTRALLGHGASHSTDVYMHLIPSRFLPLVNRHPYQTTIGHGRQL